MKENDLLKLIKTEKNELIIHFKKPISLNWDEINLLRRLFAKEVSPVETFWKDLRENKHCQFFVLETKKFGGCK